MHIAIENRATQKKSGGTKMYASKLLASLEREFGAHQFSVLPGVSDTLWKMPWWLNVTIPQALADSKPDVVHFTKSAVPFKKTLPTVVTVFDIIPILFPESQKPAARLLWPLVLRQAVERSDHILTISEASKRDMVQHLGVNPAKITVTPLAPPAPLAPPSPRPERQTPYLLWVGTIEPRKNVPLLIRAFAKIADKIPHTLVVAGRAYRGLAQVEKTIMEHSLEKRVELRGLVSPEELQQLYQGADLFVWPSLYEGWGFPPQEALAAGIPTIVSNGGSLPEVVGEAGVVVPFSETVPLARRTADAQFESYLAETIVSLLSDAEKRKRLAQAGPAWVKRFTWEAVARETFSVYEKVAR